MTALANPSVCLTSPYPVIVSVDVSPKKGTTETALFGINQERPYPRIGGAYKPEWENDDHVLFSRYGQPPKGLEPKYRVFLLKPEGPHNDSTRKDHAGYEGNPGTMTYRGKGLGEMFANIQRWHDGQWFFNWKVRGFETPNPSEGTYLAEQVEPAIVRAIEQHADQLRTAAICGLGRHMATALREAREAIDDAETAMVDALAKLERAE